MNDPATTRSLTRTALVALLVILLAGPLSAAEPTASRCEPSSACAILERFAAAWRGSEEMHLAAPISLGMRVSGEGGGAHTISITPAGAASVEDGLQPGVAATFRTDIDTLRAIDRGELSIMTAMARARLSDPAPVSVEMPEGFRWTPATQALYLPLTFHFFNRNVPEVIPFSPRTSRAVHGGRSTIFYYDRGLRTSWYSLDAGMHINADEKDRENPFKSLVIVTAGSMRTRIGGIERILRAGEAVVIPERVAHEFWTGPGESAEFVLVMFGDGA